MIGLVMTRTTSLSLSLLLMACAARPAGDEANVTTQAEGESSQTEESPAESSSTTVGVTDSESESESESEGDGDWGDGDGDEDCWEGRKLDLPPDSDPPMPESCTIEWIPWPTPEEYPGCMICQFEGTCFSDAYLGCVSPPPGQTCADLCPSGDCLGAYWNSCEGEGPNGWEEVPSDICGHYEIDGRCCTIGKFLAACAE